MHTFSRFLLGVVAVGLPVCVGLRAQTAAPAVPTGRVLVLENERLLEGDIERRGEQYCVRRQVGELWLPARKVLKLCASRDEAFLFIASRANLRDPDERIRLARWCHLNGLYDQALLQAQTAAEMRPTDRETQQFLGVIKRAAEGARHPVTVAAEPAPVEVLPPVDISSESMGAFVNRVQPILMNACARCHANGQGKEFKLLRTFEGESLNRRATQHNLAAVLRQLRPEQPYMSPLLLKATSVHGNGEQPPLKGRQSEPYRLLAEWVEATIAENPYLRQPQSPSAGLVQASAVVPGTGPRLAPANFQPAAQPLQATAPAVFPRLNSVPLDSPSVQETRQVGGPVAAPTPAGAGGQFAVDAPPGSKLEDRPAAAGPPDEYDANLFPGNQQVQSKP